MVCTSLDHFARLMAAAQVGSAPGLAWQAVDMDRERAEQAGFQARAVGLGPPLLRRGTRSALFEQPRRTAWRACVALQVEVLRREVGRLTNENSRLRGDLLREADARGARERSHYQALRALETQLAAAQFAQEQTAQRLGAVERENEGLRQKAASLLSIGQQAAAGRRRARVA